MKCLLILLALLLQVSAYSQGWKCGVNELTHHLSYGLSYFSSDQSHIRQCCDKHDQDYDSYDFNRYPRRYDSDREFDACLKRSCNLWTSYVVRPVFNVSVKLYSLWNYITTGAW